MNRNKAFSLSVWLKSPQAIIAHYVLFTFYGYFTIGLSLAVLPIFINKDLGFNMVIAGAVISLQYIMTFFMRAYAGQIVDNQGPRRAVINSMICFIASGVVLSLAFLLHESPAISLSLLILSRLLTGSGEGMVGASPINWAILKTGEKHAATAISYNGIANYSSMAIGAPLGLVIGAQLGNWTLGVLTVIMGLIGLWSAMIKPAVTNQQDAPKKSFFKVLGTIAPYGSGLAFAAIGFGTISTFITLYFVFKNWENPALCITGFSCFFILGRLFFTKAINEHGGLKVGILCMLIEFAGLTILWLAGNSGMAFIGACTAGLGFSMVFPALGVEAIKQVPASNKGAALGGYGLFIDISLGVTGPLIGFVANQYGMDTIFPFSMAMVLVAICISFMLQKRTAVLETAKA